MNDPVYAIPFFVAATIVGWIIIFKVFVRAPFRGLVHLRNIFSPKVDSNSKRESKEVVSEVGRGISSYLIFFFSLMVGMALVTLVGLIGIKILTIFTFVVVAVGLLLIYSWAQNRI